MPEGADAGAGRMRHQRVKTLLPVLIVVEPHAFAAGLGMQRAVHGDDAVADIGLERQVLQKIEIVVAQLLARPGDGARRGARELARRDPAADGEIVIAGDTHAIGAADQRDAGGGVAIVTDDVAEADDAVDRSFGNVVKCRLPTPRDWRGCRK